MASKGKYNKTIVERICQLIKSDSYTVAEICRNVGINPDTYYAWLNKKADFSDAIKRARGEYDAFIAAEAQKSLVKLIQGYSVDETKTVYENVNKKDGELSAKPKIREQTITKKHYQPSVPAVIFALTNKDSDNWKNRLNSEVTGKDGKDLIPAKVLSKKEAQELLSNLENEC